MGILRRIIKRIRELLAPAPKAGGELSTALCRRVDAIEVSAELGVAEKGRRDGERNIPGPTDENPSSTERLIEQYVQEHITRMINEAVSRLQSIEGDLKRRVGRARTALSYLETVDDRIDVAFKTLRSRQDTKEQQFRELEARSSSALKAFTSKHSIERDAEIRDSHLLIVALAVGAFVGEAIVNALFFQQGLYGGYVQGVLTASVIAAADVMVLFIAGRLAMRVHSPKSMPLHRVVGGISCLFIACWTLTYNLLAAHVREQFQAGLDWTEVSTASLASFMSHPLGLSQIDSWILFVLCMVFSGLAAFTGVSWDEPIPGFKRATLKLRFAREDLAVVIDQGRRDADQLRDELIDTAGTERLAAEQSLTELNYLVGLKGKLKSQLKQCTQYFDGLLKTLTQEYRDENSAARTTPNPPTFNVTPKISPARMPETISSVSSNQAELEQIASRVGEVVAVWATVGMKVAEHHQDYLNNSSSSIDDSTE